MTSFFFDILRVRLLTERMSPAAAYEEIVWHLNRGYIDETEARELLDMPREHVAWLNAPGGSA